MTWKPIIAGVDPSPEGTWAAATAWRLARAAGVPCHLIRVVTDVTIPPGGTPGVAWPLLRLAVPPLRLLWSRPCRPRWRPSGTWSGWSARGGRGR